jgi:trehalose utilization protein
MKMEVIIMIKVTVWNEYVHERESEAVRNIYPEGIHGCIAGFLGKEEDITVRCVTFDMPEHGLTEEVLNDTDVLIWWSHVRQEEVSEEVTERVRRHVLDGMGLIALHSAHYSKIMKRLLGTAMTLKWRDNDREHLWVTSPSHPIAAGLPERIDIPHEEMYGEFFDIPKPDDVVFTGWFAGGEVFRSGCTFTRGYGRIFYFQPGHEGYPTYYIENIQKIIINAIRWCNTQVKRKLPIECENPPAIEKFQ